MKLLLALDLHDNPETLVDQAVEWTQRSKGKLSLVFVEELGETWAVGIHDPTVVSLLETERTAIRARHRERLAQLLERIPEDLRGDAEVVAGVAWNAVVEAAKPYDLLLVGTHGRKGLAHFFLGSVAERIVRASSCSVLVLRPPAEA
ncbi:MAG: universal stress protein [Proteobacteria bacterium]|nr:universal stress protein [Pseudomonadota bacterium]